MRNRFLLAALLLPLAAFAQQTPAADNSSSAPAQQQAQPQTTDAPKDTKVTEVQSSTVVQPEKKAVKVTPEVVRAAQQRLIDQGFLAGTADGIAGPQTRAAVRKFQSDKGLAVNGKLDPPTLTKLDVGATNMLATAPGDVGAGAKAAGHDVKGGHPVAAAKAMGSGLAGGGKAVGHGAKAGTMAGVHKTGEGIAAIGRKTGNGLAKLGNKLSGKKKTDSSQPENTPPPTPR
jgi:peptidoglycan hydrolase-like protein with peptidoglycan-binding domain